MNEIHVNFKIEVQLDSGTPLRNNKAKVRFDRQGDDDGRLPALVSPAKNDDAAVSAAAEIVTLQVQRILGEIHLLNPIN